MDYWLGFFRGAGDNIFDAIAVAASDHPAALRSRRDAIAQRLYTAYRRRCLPRGAPPPRRCRRNCSTPRAPLASDRADVIADDGGVPCREDPVAAETEHIKAVLLNDQENSEATLLELLQHLRQLELTVDTLTVTEIGKAVSSYRKHNSKKIRHLVQLLIEPAISLLSTTNCFSPKHRWPEDVAWHPDGELIFAMYSADNGDSQKKVSFLPVKPHTKEIINNINFMPWSDVCFVTGGSDHAVNKKMIHGTTQKCTRICILLLSWVLLDYSKKNAILSVGSDKRIIPFDLAAGRAGSKISPSKKYPTKVLFAS
uniref:TFIIS N-terminal domain-containing protein n=1 Tax=Oryza glumipatula TaxID=40148 RepID=A0A0E0A644_9ORYZ